MTSTTVPVEPISAEPVIIHSSDSQNPAAADEVLPTRSQSQEETIEERLKKVEKTLEANHITSDVPPPQQSRYYRNRSRSRSPIRNQAEVVPLLTNTASLDQLLGTSDTLAEIMNGPDSYNRNLVYIANTPIHAADLEKVSWIFKVGIVDTWVQKPVLRASTVVYSQEFPVRIRGGEYIVDERHEDYRRYPCPILRLGSSLNIFKDDSEEYDTAKIKFLTVVQGKTNSSWVKLIVSYTRQTAMVNIFHELLTGQTVLFHGAVLKDEVVPLENKRGAEDIVFKRVADLKGLEDVGDKVVGVIC